MAQLNPTMTSEKLLLLKGTRASLSNVDVTPGAIYFTTDYPGIYVDLAAEGTYGESGYKAARRMRMGDVTVVDKLQDLQNLVVLKESQDGLTTSTGASEIDSIKAAAAPILTDKTLYYAIQENVLCMYDETNKRFIWINDHTALENAISTLTSNYNNLSNELTTAKGNIATHTQNIADLNNIIGSSNSNNTKDKTLFKSIEDAYALIGTNEGDDSTAGKSAFEAIKALDGRIDNIVGGSSDSIASLKTAIESEETARKAADETLQTQITNNDDDIADIQTLIGASSIPTGKNLYGLITDESTARTKKDEELSAAISGVSGEVTKLAQTVESNKTTITAALEAEEKAREAADAALQASLGYTKTGDSKSLYELLNEEITNRTQGDSALQGAINTHTSNISSLTSRMSTAEGNISNNATNIANEKTLREAADTQIRTDFAAADAQTLADAKSYAQNYVNSQLKAADAMTFKGSVNYVDGSTTKLDLPTSNVKAGDTYVVAADKSGGTYHAGDLMVALHDQDEVDADGKYLYQDNSGKYNGGWTQVKTGYDSTHEAKISVDSNGNKPRIKLTSHTGTTNLGSATFVTDTNSNISLGQTPGENGQISINLVWATF